MHEVSRQIKLDILAMGEAMVEFVHATHPEIGEHFTMGFGGDTSNSIIAASREGAQCGYMTALGNDRFGDKLMELWRQENIDTSAVKRNKSAATGAYFVYPDPEGRHFDYLRSHSAASCFSSSDIDPAQIKTARVLHLSAITQAISPSMLSAADHAIEMARQNNVVVSYDTNLRLKLWSIEEARRTIENTIAKTDILFPSEDEAILLTGIQDPNALVDHFLSSGVKIVVLKQGSKGALVATCEQRKTIPARKVDAVDSTGAGDAFAGAYLAHYCKTGDPFAAAERAADVAAATVSTYGALAPRR